VTALRGFWIALWCVISQGAVAQLPPISQPPPPCRFSEWTKVETTEEYTEYRVSYPSPLPSPYPANNIVPLQVFLPPASKPVPVVLILHYWGATDLKIERELASDLSKRGIAAAIMTLPFHLQRTPEGHRSGSLAVTGDPDSIKFTLVEAVMDARRAIDFLASRPEFDSKQLGLAGISLGSIISSAVYGVDSRVSRAAFLLGGVDLAHILWNSSRVVPEREGLRKSGFTESTLADVLAPVEPLTLLKSRTEIGHAFVVGAKFDTVIPRQSTEDLISALPNAQTLWIDTGHYGGIFVQDRLLQAVSKYFESGFKKVAYAPPRGIVAPTVRIGADFGLYEGFDISLGIDFVRRRSFHSPMGTFLLTPRGPRVFLGQGIDRAVALGVLFTPSHVRAAVLWSIVL
jgi:hypothetical protein